MENHVSNSLMRQLTHLSESGQPVLKRASAALMHPGDIIARLIVGVSLYIRHFPKIHSHA